MDDLSKLPVEKASNLTAEEASVLKKYFGDSPKPSAAKPEESTKKGYIDKAKFVASAAIVFALISNPWTDGILSGFSYCGTSIGRLMIKVLLFFIVLMVMYVYYY